MRLQRLVTILLLASTACLTAPSREVALQISAIDLPATVSPDSVLRLRIKALAGGCRFFDRFEVTRNLVDVDVRAVGIDRGRPDHACTDDIRVHEGTYVLLPPYGDSVIVRGRQPDGSAMVRVVRVQ